MIKVVKQPTLIIHGGKDKWLSDENARALKRARGNKSTETIIFKDLDHFYKKVPSDSNSKPVNPDSLKSDPSVADAIVLWIEALSTQIRSKF